MRYEVLFTFEVVLWVLNTALRQQSRRNNRCGAFCYSKGSGTPAEPHRRYGIKEILGFSIIIITNKIIF